MPSLFDLDDIVICENDSDYENYLTNGKLYKVLRILNNCLEVISDDGVVRVYAEARFSLTNKDMPKFKVNDIVINVNDDDDDLTFGKPYKVLRTDEEFNTIEICDDVNDKRTRYSEYYATFEEYVKDLAEKVELAKHVTHKVGDTYSYNNDIYTLIETSVNNITYYALMCADGNIWNRFDTKINVPNNFRKI